KHPKFWFADGNCIVMVADTEYNVHRYLFAGTKAFSGQGIGGMSPYYLSATKTDFERLLTILYPASHGEHECETTEEWTSVLRLADRWDMHDIRRLAIAQLELCAGPVDKIALGERYGVQEWLVPAYLELCTRKAPITTTEGYQIGVEALVRIAELKNEVFANLASYLDQDKFAELFASKWRCEAAEETPKKGLVLSKKK
ncbi:hypothetical protein C8J57DRAFT_1048994, partial [Mycena rebaudengoi]